MTLSARISLVVQAVAADIKALFSRAIPPGGAVGSVLTKTTETDYAVGWVAPGGTAPKLNNLLVYYGYPSVYKGLYNNAAVIADIAANYATWVCGDTYQQPSHPDYANTQAIIAGVRAAGVKVWGYVAIGVSSQNLSIATMQTAVDQWVTLGVDGIFLDEFGFGYLNPRTRQKDMVDYVHGKGIPICANAWIFEDFVCDNIAELTWPTNDWKYVNFQTYNPTNLALTRWPTDVFLLENFCYDNVSATDQWVTQENASLVRTLNLSKNVTIWALAVLAETVGGVIDTSKTGRLSDIKDICTYVAANALLYDIGTVGVSGYSMGSGGIPIAASMPQLPAQATPPALAAVNDYGAGKYSRAFGPVTVVVRNLGGSTQSVSISPYPSLAQTDAASTLTLDTRDTTVSAPASGTMRLLAKNSAMRTMPAFRSPSGADVLLQPHLSHKHVAIWRAQGNAATAPVVFGIGAATAVGTVTARNVATTNVATRIHRLGYVSAATAGALAGHFFAAAQYTMGDGAGIGGFHYADRIVTSDAVAVAGARMFVGLSSSVAAPINVNPNTLTNCVGFAQLTADATQWYLVYGGSAAQAAIPLGTALGSPNLTNTGWDVALFANPDVAGQVGYAIKNIASGVTVEGVISPKVGTQIPPATTLLAPRAWRCNNATLLACGLDIASMYIETEQ